MPSRQPSSAEQEIIGEILDNYSCRPSEKSYSHYAETAVFHDPVSIARGKESIMSQFNGMPKVFARSETKREFEFSSGLFLRRDELWDLR